MNKSNSVSSLHIYNSVVSLYGEYVKENLVRYAQNVTKYEMTNSEIIEARDQKRIKT